nr:serine hydrolase domain-containing protein [Sphingomonas sp. Y57]
MSAETVIDALDTRAGELGFDTGRLAYIDQVRAAQVETGEMAGIVTLIARHGKIAHYSAVGYADLASRARMRRDTVFRLYAMTRPIIATALMTLYEDGAFQLADPISTYIPGFADLAVLRTPESPIEDIVPAARQPRIHDLLRHTAGFARGSGRPDGSDADSTIDAAYLKANLFDPDSSLADMMRTLAPLPLRHQPGTTWEYGISADIQARLVEILSGMPIDRFLEQRIFGPLGMKDSGYRPRDPSRLAAIHWWKGDRLVPCGTAHGYPEPANYLLERRNIDSYARDNALKGGSNGLVGTVMDYWRFAQMLLNGGEWEGRRILGRPTVDYMARDHLGPITIPNPGNIPSGMGFGLGLGVMKDPVAMGILGSEGQIFWFGGSHALFWIDPKEQLVVVALTQHTAMPPLAVNIFLSQMRAMIYSALC